MAKKKVEAEQVIKEDIIEHSLDNLMGECYSVYAKDVVQGRSIPDVRDGLKPVQRRIIFDMNKNGYFAEKETVKCAKIVGDVIGKFHPHGDTSVYDALVRISQNWKLINPLVEFQGNNGSIDGDGAAAYRYTEAKMSKLAVELINDIDKDTVDMVLNFDDTEYEPVVLPAKFPNLYVNGADGIAVGISTAIPTHNLKEMCDAVVYRIQHQDCTLDELLEIVKGPDFPTGGIIYDGPGLRSMYETGRGKVEICSKWTIENDKNGTHVIITEIPYEVQKKKLVYEIDKIVHSNQIDGLLEVRDETEMEGVRIVLDIKEGSDPNIILEYLKKQTPLLSSYSPNMVAIVNGRPKLLSLTDYLDAFIDFQQEILTRKSKHDLQANLERVHVLDGIIKAVSIIDDVIATIKNSSNKGDARTNLMTKFDFTEPQAEAILMMQLYRLSNTDIVKIEEEIKSLNKEISHLKSILSSKSKLNSEIIVEIQSISSRYSVDRKSIISSKSEDIVINKRDLISNEEMKLAVTSSGYIKRSSLISYDRSKSDLPGIKKGDLLVAADNVFTIDYALCFTNKGNFLFLPIHEIVEQKWKEEGKHINYLVQLPVNEKIVKVIAVEDFDQNVYICAVSKQGQIRRTLLSEFVATRTSKPIGMMKLGVNDELADVCFTTGNSDLLIFSNDGKAIKFNENDITPSKLKTFGSKAMKNLKDGQIVSLYSLEQGEKVKVLLITDGGFTSIIDSNNIDVSERALAGSVVMKYFKSEPHSIIGTCILDTKAEKNVFYLMLDNDDIISFEVNDYHLGTEKYARRNYELVGDKNIKGIYNFPVNYIKKGLKTYVVETPKVQNEETPADDEEDSDSKDFEQISMFDLNGD